MAFRGSACPARLSHALALHAWVVVRLVLVRFVPVRLMPARFGTGPALRALFVRFVPARFGTGPALCPWAGRALKQRAVCVMCVRQTNEKPVRASRKNDPSSRRAAQKRRRR